MRILVVDDNQDGAKTMARALTLMSHQVHVVFSGSMAVKDVGLFRPQLVLLDINMSGIDGYETCRAIRQLLGQDVFLVAVTGSGSAEDRQRSRDAGFNEHLVKPVDWALLTTVLRSLEAP